jgi:hypothetical protein
MPPTGSTAAATFLGQCRLPGRGAVGLPARHGQRAGHVRPPPCAGAWRGVTCAAAAATATSRGSASLASAGWTASAQRQGQQFLVHEWTIEVRLSQQKENFLFNTTGCMCNTQITLCADRIKFNFWAIAT